VAVVNGLGVLFTVLVIGVLGTLLVQQADRELDAWRAERRVLRRRSPVGELPPAVTGVRPAPRPVLYDQDDDELLLEVGGPDWGAA